MPFGWNDMLGRMDGLMGAPQIPQGGVMGEPQVNPQQDMRLALASNLLAGSNSGQGFNTILGKALLAGQAARQNAQAFQQQAREQQSQEQLRQAQINNLQNPQEPDQVRTARALQADPALAKVYEDMRRHGMDPTDPAAVRIYLFRQGLNDQQRADFDAHQFAPPQVTFQNTPGMGSVIVDPANRTGRGTITQLKTPEEERAALVATKGAEATASASGTATGAAQGQAAADLPRVKQNVEQGIGIIDKLIKSPGLGNITGIFSLAPIVPGTDQAAADALAKQVEGNTFLQAYQTLKGGGSITETEGTKAQAAIARLSRKQGKEDYVSALTDLRDVLQAGYDRMKKSATSSPNPSTKVRKYNPATGAIE